MSNLDPVLVYPWGVGSLQTKHPHTEPIGIARVDQGRYHLVKINWHTTLNAQWNSCRYQPLTEAEYDMHLEFGTFPVLKVKYPWLRQETKWKLIDYAILAGSLLCAIVNWLFL